MDESADRQERRAAFIASNAQAREIYLLGREQGYSEGYAKGWQDADEAAESHAEHAARLFYAMEAGEIVHKQFARSAQNAIDVVAAREELKRGVSR